MMVKEGGAKRATAWYLKTRAGVFLSLFVFLVLFFMLTSVLSSIIENYGIAAIISVILSIGLAGLFLYIYNKRYVKEWKTTKSKEPVNKIPNAIATSFIVVFILSIILHFIFDLNWLRIVSKIILGALFFAYIYFKFIKK